MRTLCCLIAAVGCATPVDEASVAPTAPNQLRNDGKADDGLEIWAGLTSVTLERYVPDPCNDGKRALGDEAVRYDSWVRQRAGIRNLCFEVWSPGITDWENPDFWQQLDVQVHYRFDKSADYQHAYVSSNGRRYNNRRYGWTLEYSVDPLAWTSTVPSVKVPFSIIGETQDWADVAADLDVYFTVNGRVLNAPSNKPFTIRYEASLRKPSLAVSDAGYVLHDIVTCSGARFGSGAGYFVADVTSPAAIATLGAGADGSLIYGVPLARGTNMLSFTYGTQSIEAGQTLPGFFDAGGMRIVPSGSTMRVELDVYDRALGRNKTITSTFTGCSADPS